LVDELRDLELQYLGVPPTLQQVLPAPSKVSVKVGKPVARPDFYTDAE
jgi:hypothetical protein